MYYLLGFVLFVIGGVCASIFGSDIGSTVQKKQWWRLTFGVVIMVIGFIIFVNGDLVVGYI